MLTVTRHGPSAPVRPDAKILGLEDLLARRARLRAQGQTITQCHGCFDLVHPGHVRHLKHAAEQADVLLVTLTPDELVGKGDHRPIFPDHLRAENLAALGCVDFVCVNPCATAEELLRLVQPDVYVKGREYELNDDPRFEAERRAVEDHGGRIVFTSGDVVFSSTALLAALPRDPAEATSPVDRLHAAHNLAPEALDTLTERFANRTALVVGETIIDTHVLCDRPDVASEAACLSLRPIERASFDGGAAVIASHLAALGATPTLVTALPESAPAEAFLERMRGQGVDVRAVRCGGEMLEKQRFMVDGAQVMKLDLVHPVTIDARQQDELFEHTNAAEHYDVAVLADFGHGLLTPHALERLSLGLRPRVGVLAGDVSGRRSSLGSLRGMDLLTPTEFELREAMGDYDSSINAVVWALMSRTGARVVIVTMADAGLVVFQRTPNTGSDGWRSRVWAEHIPALLSHAADPLGCGDALLSAASIALACGASTVQAGYAGSLAAAAESAIIGNLPVSAATLRREARRHTRPTLAMPSPVVLKQTPAGPRTRPAGAAIT